MLDVGSAEFAANRVAQLEKLAEIGVQLAEIGRASCREIV
jgi:hypothetical protein